MVVQLGWVGKEREKKPDDLGEKNRNLEGPVAHLVPHF